MSGYDPGRRRPPWNRKGLPGWIIIAGSLVIAGTVLAVAGLLSSGRQPRALPAVPVSPVLVSPATAPAERHGPAAHRRPGPSRSPVIARHAPAMAGSEPVRLRIPSIGVDASVIPLGVTPDGQAEVPPLTEPMLTSWLDEGPSPGQNGPAAIYGHVDTAATGPAVFYRLGDVATGAGADVTLADGQVAVFQVYRVAEYPKDAFPTMAVYGDTNGPELRLITCGGAFDPSLGSYDDNIVAYARLVATT